jgi:hypothetical protein
MVVSMNKAVVSVYLCCILLGVVLVTNGQDNAAACWRQNQIIKLAPYTAKAIAVDKDSNIYTAVESSPEKSKILIFNAAGETIENIAVDIAVVCICVTNDGTIFAAGNNKIVRFNNASGKRQCSEWQSFSEESMITSIATAGDRVFVADAGKKCVAVFDTSSVLLHTVLSSDGFVIPSPYFSVVADNSDGFWVANPGRHQIENYAANGRFIALWKPARSHGFLGCCNPAFFQLLSGGRFVTSEKGIIRVRIFAPDGRFEATVCGADTFMPGSKFGHAIAVDKNQRIIVVDPKEQLLRIFSITARNDKAVKNETQ